MMRRLLLVALLLSTPIVRASGTGDAVQQTLGEWQQRIPSIPQCSDDDPQPDETKADSWSCMAKFADGAQPFAQCMQAWASSFKAYLQGAAQPVCVIPAVEGRAQLFEGVVGDGKTPTEQAILQAPCSSSIGDVHALVLEANYVLMYAPKGVIYWQLMQRFGELAKAVAARIRACSSSQPTSASLVAPTSTIAGQQQGFGVVNVMISAQKAAQRLKLPPPKTTQDAWDVLFQQRQAAASKCGSDALLDYPVGEEPVDDSSAPATSDPLDPAYSPAAAQNVAGEGVQADGTRFLQAELTLKQGQLKAIQGRLVQEQQRLTTLKTQAATDPSVTGQIDALTTAYNRGLARQQRVQQEIGQLNLAIQQQQASANASSS